MVNVSPKVVNVDAHRVFDDDIVTFIFPGARGNAVQVPMDAVDKKWISIVQYFSYHLKMMQFDEKTTLLHCLDVVLSSYKHCAQPFF